MHVFNKFQEKLKVFYMEQSIYGLGGRKIGVTSLPPLGCLPIARTIFGYHESGCVSRFNTDAQQFNKKINSAAAQLQKQYPDLKLVIFDVFKPLYDVVSDPKKNGTHYLYILQNFISGINLLCFCRIYRGHERLLRDRDCGDDVVVVQS